MRAHVTDVVAGAEKVALRADGRLDLGRAGLARRFGVRVHPGPERSGRLRRRADHVAEAAVGFPVQRQSGKDVDHGGRDAGVGVGGEQRGHGSGPVRDRREDQGRLPRRPLPGVRIRAVVEQRGHRRPARPAIDGAGGEVQRSHAAVRRHGVRVRPGFEQAKGDGAMPALGGHLERRIATDARAGVNRGASRDQRIGHGPVPALGGQVQRGQPVAARRVHVRPLPQEGAYDFDLPVAGGREQPLVRARRVLRRQGRGEDCRDQNSL